MGYNNKHQQNWEELIAAMIKLAAQDYKSNYNKAKKYEKKRDYIIASQSDKDWRKNKKKIDSLNFRIEESLNELRKIEQFFRSSWFQTISILDGNNFFDKLKEQVENEYATRESGTSKKSKR